MQEGSDEVRLRCQCGVSLVLSQLSGKYVHEDDEIKLRGRVIISSSNYDHEAVPDVLETTCSVVGDRTPSVPAVVPQHRYPFGVRRP